MFCCGGVPDSSITKFTVMDYFQESHYIIKKIIAPSTIITTTEETTTAEEAPVSTITSTEIVELEPTTTSTIDIAEPESTTSVEPKPTYSVDDFPPLITTVDEPCNICVFGKDGTVALDSGEYTDLYEFASTTC